jgi:sarcosine oxidase subunit gamma
MSEQALRARAPFLGMSGDSSAGRGVIATDRDGLGLATVALRKGQMPALAECVSRRFGIALPEGPLRRSAGGIAFAGTGPAFWLASQERGGNEFAAALHGVVGAFAAVTDQSDGYAVLRLAGPKVRDTLAKLAPIDVHPRAFKPGDVASTVISHAGATFWRLEDDADGTPVFEIALFRSLAASFWRALAEAAAEFGLVVTP